MLARIDRNRQVPLRAAYGHTIARDRQPGHLLLRRHHDGELAQHRLQLLGAFAGDFGTLVAGAHRELLRFLVAAPRARSLAGFFVALREMQQRAEAGIELLALGVLAARRIEGARGLELLGFLEERLGGGNLAGVLRRGGSGGQQHGGAQEESGRANHRETERQRILLSPADVVP